LLNTNCAVFPEHQLHLQCRLEKDNNLTIFFNMNRRLVKIKLNAQLFLKQMCCFCIRTVSCECAYSLKLSVHEASTLHK